MYFNSFCGQSKLLPVLYQKPHFMITDLFDGLGRISIVLSTKISILTEKKPKMTESSHCEHFSNISQQGVQKKVLPWFVKLEKM